MNREIADDLLGYFNSLYDLNRNLIKLCGVDCIRELGYCINGTIDIMQEISRLIPYNYCKVDDKIYLSNKDGLMEYAKVIPYLKDDFNEILKNNDEFLKKQREIRNKYEHKVHAIKFESSSSSSMGLFYVEFKVEDKQININAGEVIKTVKQLNILYNKLVRDTQDLIFKEKIEHNPYFERITKFDFEDFNKIYDSNLLRLIGMITYEY